MTGSSNCPAREHGPPDLVADLAGSQTDGNHIGNIGLPVCLISGIMLGGNLGHVLRNYSCGGCRLGPSWLEKTMSRMTHISMGTEADVLQCATCLHIPLLGTFGLVAAFFSCLGPHLWICLGFSLLRNSRRWTKGHSLQALLQVYR